MILLSLISLMKKIPIDLGQGTMRERTKGKLIAETFVNEGNGAMALDVGCREGVQSKWIKEKGYKVISIYIIRKYKDCILVDIEKPLHFKDNYFDLIWCSEVIEHINNPVFTIKELKRVLRYNCYMILTTPNSYCLPFWLFSLFLCVI